MNTIKILKNEDRTNVKWK